MQQQQANGGNQADFLLVCFYRWACYFQIEVIN